MTGAKQKGEKGFGKNKDYRQPKNFLKNLIINHFREIRKSTLMKQQ